MRMLAAVLCLAAASAVPPTASAEGKGGGGDWRAHCGDDVDRLCPKTRDPGACIHAHWDDLSEGCRSFKAGMRKKGSGEEEDGSKGGEGKGKGEGKQGGPGDWKTSCGADVERFCPGSPNPGMCLHEHWEEISSECRAFKESMKRRWEKKKGGHPGKEGKAAKGGEGDYSAEKKEKMRFEWSEKKKEAGASE